MCGSGTRCCCRVPYGRDTRVGRTLSRAGYSPPPVFEFGWATSAPHGALSRVHKRQRRACARWPGVALSCARPRFHSRERRQNARRTRRVRQQQHGRGGGELARRSHAPAPWREHHLVCATYYGRVRSTQKWRFRDQDLAGACEDRARVQTTIVMRNDDNAIEFKLLSTRSSRGGRAQRATTPSWSSPSAFDVAPPPVTSAARGRAR